MKVGEEQSSDTCKEFLNALYEMEQTGASTNIFEIGRQIFGEGSQGICLGLYARCKAKGWLMGAAEGTWLTPQGKIVIGKP